MNRQQKVALVYLPVAMTLIALWAAIELNTVIGGYFAGIIGGMAFGFTFALKGVKYALDQ